MEVRSRRGCEEGRSQAIRREVGLDGLRPLRRYTLRIASLVKKLMRKRAPRRVCSSRPVQTRLDEELVVRLSGKGKKLVRQRAPRHQRRNLEEFQRRGAALFYALIDVVASSLDRGVAYRG